MELQTQKENAFRLLPQGDGERFCCEKSRGKGPGVFLLEQVAGKNKGASGVCR